MFEERNIQYLWPEDFRHLKRAYLPDVVLQIKNAGGIQYLDFGTIFYGEHLAVSKRTHAAPVKKNSLIKNIVEPIKEYFLDMLERYSHASLKHFLKVIRNVVKDVYALFGNLDFNNKDEILIIYRKYTDYLTMCKSNVLKNPTAYLAIYNRKQTVFAEILARALHVDINEIRNSYIEIASKHKSHHQPVEEEKLTIFFELNKRIFTTFSDFLIKNNQFPVNLLFEDIGVNLQLFSTEDLNLEGIPKLGEINSTKAKMINLSSVAFVNCFASASAINPAQLYNLKLKDMYKLRPSTKGMRIVTIKPRAGYKPNNLTLPAKFKIILNEYLNFREWVFKNYDTEKESKNKNVSDQLFIGLNNRKSKYCDKYIISYSSNQHQIYKYWFKSTFPNVAWVTLVQLRASVANVCFNETNSSAAVSQKLGNSPKIAARAYSEPTENQFLSEMSTAFNEITNAASIISKNPIPIKIDIDNTQSTEMGHCISHSPHLAKDYQSSDLGQPNCSNPISCLFCENYVLHTDAEDIRKILSAKRIFELADAKQDAENIFIVQQRLSDILDYIEAQHLDKKELITTIKKEVSKGKLTDFFSIQLNLLIDLGVDFHE